MRKKTGIESAYRELVAAGISVKKDFPLKKVSNFRIGGKAGLFIEIKSEKELGQAIKVLRGNGIRYMAAGNMTNLLIADGRLKMAFIKLAGPFAGIEKKSGRVRAGAAAGNNRLLNFLVKHGLGGLEFLAGIPGTIGGAVYMNAGAYGKGIGAFIHRVYFTDKNGKARSLSGKGAKFSYRHSGFMNSGSIITAADIMAVKRDRKESAAEMRGIIGSRHNKHPWDAACAGSFFRNPADITAGKLIEMAGLKGARVGGAKVSEKHANFLINAGGATFKDVIRLSAKVKSVVWRRFKVRLKEEVIIIR